MRTADFDFYLPPELVAQVPAPRRDASRLLVLHRDTGQISHRNFRDLLDCLSADDVLVLNNSRVIPARLRGASARSGGRFEILLLEENGVNDWWALLRPAKRARVGTPMVIRDSAGNPSTMHATIVDRNEDGHRRLLFTGTPNISDALETLGEAPLPPYIRRADASQLFEDRQRYQTVFAEPPGSVAAPTAGLHFTTPLLDEIRSRSVRVCFITLHVGLATFAPVKSESIEDHKMHEERFEVSAEAADIINKAKSSGRRVIAGGTTTVRALEAVAAQSQGRLVPTVGRTRIFIYPPYHFKMVDALLTNFHLPRSTLLMLVSAFAAPSQTRGREMILSAYAEAIRQRYRFFSYGDAMLVL
jgi:S-adenosylmethionine:tRNA ribosyltransferase-isomerase